MAEEHKVDKYRISSISGDFRSLADMEYILGMPLPDIDVSSKKKQGVKPAYSERVERLVPPSDDDIRFTLDLPSRDAAREFASGFNDALGAFTLSRARDWEAGEMTYRYRGSRFLSVYINYCERYGIAPKRCRWDGALNVDFFLER